MMHQSVVAVAVQMDISGVMIMTIKLQDVHAVVTTTTKTLHLIVLAHEAK